MLNRAGSLMAADFGVERRTFAFLFLTFLSFLLFWKSMRCFYIYFFLFNFGGDMAVPRISVAAIKY